MKSKVLLVSAFAVLLSFGLQARAEPLPLSSASPLTGVSFDDSPLWLPVDRNFQMALMTVSTELGRTCGKMEAFAWRMNQSEQTRVNTIFSKSVDQLRTMGYTIAPETLKSGSKDITIFTADSKNKHFLFLWSANELGLVLNLCETSIPISPTHRPPTVAASSQVFNAPAEPLDPAHMLTLDKPKKKATGDFTPVGTWVGSYSCGQGQTGATLQIKLLNKLNFDGVFSFYGTEKNPSVPEGAYVVYGQYDRDTRRILINPGSWIDRPKGYYNTVIVGSFDPVEDTFSGYFEGVKGCTSFEAHRAGAGEKAFVKKKVEAKKAVVKKAKVTKKKAKKAIPLVKKEAVPEVPVETTVAPVDTKADPGIDLTQHPLPAETVPAKPVPTPPAEGAAPASTAPAPSAPAPSALAPSVLAPSVLAPSILAPSAVAPAAPAEGTTVPTPPPGDGLVPTAPASDAMPK